MGVLAIMCVDPTTRVCVCVCVCVRVCVLSTGVCVIVRVCGCFLGEFFDGLNSECYV